MVFKIQATAWFLGVVYMLKQGPNRNITFYLKLSQLNIAKKPFKQDIDRDIVFANKQIKSTFLSIQNTKNCQI
jgi:hypothetical protein